MCETMLINNKPEFYFAQLFYQKEGGCQGEEKQETNIEFYLIF